MIHKMRLHNEPFISIKKKSKDIELRLNDEKRRLINVNDFIEFTNTKTNEVIMTKVIKLHVFKSFYELYACCNKVSLGYNECDISDPNDMEMYYSKEDINKYGVVGIEIKVI